MSPAERDPFSVLARLPVPEPNEAAVRAVVAASRSAFLRRAHAGPSAAGHGMFARLKERFGRFPPWMVRGGLGLAGTVVAAAVLAVILMLQEDLDTPPGEPSVAEAPAGEAPADAAGPGAPESPLPGSVRMGAQPTPPGQPVAPAVVPDSGEGALDPFEGDRIRLGSRLEGDQFAIYLIWDGGRRLLGQVAAEPGQEIVDATRYPRPRGEPEVIAVATGGPGGATRTWAAFLLDQSSARLDPELTEVLVGATDAADVEQRINAALRR